MPNLTVTPSMTTPTRPGKAPRPVWNVTGPDVDAFTNALYELGGKKWRGAFSFFEDPTDAITRLTDDDRLSFAERQELARERAGERADRLHDSADRHAAEAERRSNFVWSTVNQLNGQPVLIGHHSQRRHERLLERMDANLGKAVEERQYAGELERRAQLNERKASGEHTPAFVGRRIKEAEAEVRKIERYLARPDVPANDGTDAGWTDAVPDPANGYLKGAYVCTGEWRARLLIQKAEADDRLAYWKAQLVQADAPAYSKANVKAGDSVRIRGEWMRVERANPTTVTAQPSAITWTLKYPYSEIQEHRPA